MEEDTYREIASHQDIGSTRIQREQQGEIYQIVLRLKRPGISEVEQIAALQQIIILAVSTFDRADIMQERGIIETASSLLVKSKNSKIKQLCGAIISLVGWLGIQNTIEIDWASVCYPLTQMLFSTNEEISNTGKNALTNLLEQSEDASLDWIAMKKDLEKQEIGSEAQQIDVRQKKIKICQKIISTFIQRKNHECLKHAIQSGIIDALLHLLMTQPLENIQISHAWAFYIFTYSTYEEIGFLFLSKNPFPALLRLFDHRDAFVVNRAVVSIFNILLAGSDTTEANSPHPYFTAMESCGGIQKLFALFQSNRSEYSKIRVSYCFGQLYRARELQMDEIKNEVISHLKLLLYDSDASTKNSAKFALKSLALDKANRAFIEKEGFKIPK
ncbi:MAG: hypothetical protein EZS28_006347 [Streblomastix strix]|uniref:Uncharacterized protein n=1 Tax=Streblomastix strix TaxID=222440 RepID=A0A5J4WSK5_9EUKA|nr:MAG: hypothetical protein EZS28_006347 [Streblomastix strix]